MIKHMSLSLFVVLTMITTAYQDETPDMLEENIPFDIHISDHPKPHCDSLEIIVEIKESEPFRWLVMDGNKIQLEFETFDDLYYQCDGPSCFRVRTLQSGLMPNDLKNEKSWHVCLK